MNLRDLRYLVAVAEERHFGRAAARCAVSQPTLSAQIRKLEESLGITVFERSPRRVVPTPVGVEVLAEARQALAHAEAIERLAEEARDPLAGRVRLGVIPTLGPYLVPPLLQAAAERLPRLALALQEEVTDLLLARLQRHELDLALIATEPALPGLDSLPLFDEGFWLACPADHPLATLRQIGPETLDRRALLLLDDAHCLAGQAMAACAAGPPPGGDNLRAASLETLLGTVALGRGYTLVPALAVRPPWRDHPGLAFRPLVGPGSRRSVRLAFRASHPRRRTLEALADCVRAAAEPLLRKA